MMVERKPDISHLEQFGPDGNFYVCDWEMAHVGCKGRDVGTFFGYPFVAASFLAARGFSDKASDIIHCMQDFWTEYKQIMIDQANTDDTELTEIFRYAIAQFGWFDTFVFYIFRAFSDHIETEGLLEEEVNDVYATTGLIGLKCMELGYLYDTPPKDFGFEELEEFFFGMLQKELDFLADTIGKRASRRKGSRRRSSLLRVSGRRVSDSEAMFGKITKRLSQINVDLDAFKE